MIWDAAWAEVAIGALVTGLMYGSGFALGDPTLICIGGIGVGLSVGRAAWLVLGLWG